MVGRSMIFVSLLLWLSRRDWFLPHGFVWFRRPDGVSWRAH